MRELMSEHKELASLLLQDPDSPFSDTPVAITAAPAEKCGPGALFY
jgi:hypothetical protein